MLLQIFDQADLNINKRKKEKTVLTAAEDMFCDLFDLQASPYQFSDMSKLYS